jgi:hypothetical protein
MITLPHVSPLRVWERLTPSEAMARADKLIEQLRRKTLPPLRMRGHLTKEQWNRWER